MKSRKSSFNGRETAPSSGKSTASTANSESQLKRSYISADVTNLYGKSMEEDLERLADTLQQRSWRSDALAQFLVSFYYGLLSDFKDAGMEPAAANSLFNLVYQLLNQLEQVPEDMVSAYTQFERSIRGMMGERVKTPDRKDKTVPVKITKEEVNELLEFTSSTIFQHYKLYQAAFSQVSDQETTRVEKTIQTPTPLPPLSEAQTLEQFETEERERQDRLRREFEESLENQDVLSFLSAEEIKDLTMQILDTCMSELDQAFQQQSLQTAVN